jgi:hypothetical protein
VHRIGRTASRQDSLSDTRATLPLRDGGEILIERAESRATFTFPEPVRTDALVHPLLAPVGAVMAYWLGRESVHAGAIVVGGRVWGLVGERGAGKSTTVACCVVRGCGLVSDDLLVLDQGRAFAGPRSIDLRREAAERLGVGEALGVVGTRERWRIVAEPVGPRLELAGWIFLAWGERLGAVPVSAAERLRRLHLNRGVTVPPRDPAALLDVATLPGWELRRPRGWESLTAAVELLLATIG